MAAGLIIIFAAGAFARAVPYPPARIASIIIKITPGDLATAMIERLGHGAIRILSVLSNIGTVAFGGYLGMVVSRPTTEGARARRGLAAAGALWLAAMGLALTSREGFSITALAIYPIAAIVFGRVASGERLLGAFQPEVRGGDTPLDAIRRSRRRFLVRVAAGLGGFVIGGATVLRLTRGGGRMNVEIARADRGFRPPPEDPNFGAITGLSREITPTASFYVVDINIVKPSVDHTDWALGIHGLVESPYKLTYRSLQNDFEVIEIAHTLTCISNEIGGNLVSTTVWRGVRLKDVLDRSGLKDGVVDVVLRAADGYSDSIPLEKAIEETTIVAFGMNGEALPREHGFPARLVVPGIYGMKNVKWLMEIEPFGEDYKGYWERRGWSDIARVKTQSRIDTPSPSAQVALPAKVAGAAWAGDRGIKQVQISDDGGATWKQALLKRELAPLAWRLWAADIAPGKGRRRIVVRATDGADETQPDRRTRPHPDGASGRHQIEFLVE